MTDRQKIIDTYDRLEAEAGGIAKCVPLHVAQATAAELQLPYEEVRAVLLDAWTTMGAG